MTEPEECKLGPRLALLTEGEPVMPVSDIFSFLVHPSKKAKDQPEIRGARVPLRGKLFQMLEGLYSASQTDCDTDIIFRSSAERNQHNPCRDLVLTFLDYPTISHGRSLAARLQSVTTQRSGLGLLFLVKGDEQGEHNLLLARFPAEQGVVANESGRSLAIEFLERVFMKSAHAYKSAIYRGKSLTTGFWDGRAVDKQINAARELSLYWISEFLDSELKSTPAAGTKRLALAIRDVIKSASNPNVKEQLIAATRLVPGHGGKRLSPAELSVSLGLDDEIQDAIRGALPRPELFDERFEISASEFNQHILYRAVELSNGAVLVAENERFDAVFQHDQVAEDRTRYITEGRVVSQQLRKTK